MHDGDSGNGRAAGRFYARRGIHTVRFGSTDYAHSSLTEGTSINVAQEHGAICLGRESSQLQHRGRRRLTADARGRISCDLVIRGLYFTFTISGCRGLPSSDIYRFYPGSPRKLLANVRRDNQLTAGHFIADLSQLEFCDQGV